MRVGSARIEGKGSYQGSNGLMRNLDRQMYRMEFDPFLSLDPFLPGFGCEPTGSFPFTFSILEAPRFFPRKEHVLFKTFFSVRCVHSEQKSCLFNLFPDSFGVFLSWAYFEAYALAFFTLGVARIFNFLKRCS